MKKLPIVNSPTLSCVLPVSRLKVKYRPFVVKEQKALLLAKESDNTESILETLKAVMLSCTDGTLDFEKATVDDIAYFFLQLRIASVGEEVRFSLPCVSCGDSVIINMDLSKVTVDAENRNTIVMITDTIGIKFRFPTFNDTITIDEMDTKLKGIGATTLLIESIFDGDEVYNKSEYSDSDLEKWIENLNEDQLGKIEEFFSNIPRLKHELNFTCPHCKTEQSRLLEGLHNFFRLGSVT
jgi:hypothetical protein